MLKNQSALIEQARTVVREAAYNAAVFITAGVKGQDYSRAVTIYRYACDLLHAIDPQAGRFIASTYQVDQDRADADGLKVAV